MKDEIGFYFRKIFFQFLSQEGCQKENQMCIRDRFNGGGLYISYGTYKDNVPAWKTCLLAVKLEMCYRLKEERLWKY